MRVKIYQINTDRDDKQVKFCDIETMRKLQGSENSMQRFMIKCLTQILMKLT